MKFWYSKYNLIFVLFLFTASIVLAVVVFIDAGLMLVVDILPLLIIWFCVRYRHRILSKISINQAGVQATVFRETFFSARWDEMEIVGEFSNNYKYGPYPYFVFSKLSVPFPNDKMIIYTNLTKQQQREHRSKVLLIYQTPEIKEEVLKYVDESEIVNYGNYRPEINRFN